MTSPPSNIAKGALAAPVSTKVTSGPTSKSASSNSEPEDLNPFHVAGQQFDRAVAHLREFKRGLIDFLKSPIRTITVCFPVHMEVGSVQTFTGFRVLHSQVRGPGKGGIRYHPDPRPEG